MNVNKIRALPIQMCRHVVVEADDDHHHTVEMVSCSQESSVTLVLDMDDQVVHILEVHGVQQLVHFLTPGRILEQIH